MKATNLEQQQISIDQQPAVAKTGLLNRLVCSKLMVPQNNNTISANTSQNTARSAESLIYQYRYVLISLLGAITYILFASDAFAANSLEEQLDSINTLTNDKIKTYGITGATIAGGIWAIIKGNVKLAGIIVLIGIILGYYLQWIAGGMAITAG
jgi:hypothetical protein